MFKMYGIIDLCSFKLAKILEGMLFIDTFPLTKAFCVVEQATLAFTFPFLFTWGYWYVVI